MQDAARAHLIVAGRVQGVCFRAETQQAAARLGLTGWVRNRRDGSVEAIVEGVKSDVVALIDWCRSGPPMSRVTEVSVTWQTHRGEFTDFGIRFQGMVIPSGRSA